MAGGCIGGQIGLGLRDLGGQRMDTGFVQLDRSLDWLDGWDFEAFVLPLVEQLVQRVGSQVQHRHIVRFGHFGHFNILIAGGRAIVAIVCGSSSSGGFGTLASLGHLGDDQVTQGLLRSTGLGHVLVRGGSFVAYVVDHDFGRRLLTVGVDRELAHSGSLQFVEGHHGVLGGQQLAQTAQLTSLTLLFCRGRMGTR